MTDPVVPIHCHTSYSTLDGAAKVNELVKRASEYGLPGLHVSDHGHLRGAVDVYKECQKYDINCILGEEFYMADDRTEKSGSAGVGTIDGSDKRYYHLTSMASNEAGFRNLIKMSSEAFLSGYYYQPRTDWELLEKYHEGLIVTTGCLGGKVLQQLLHGDYDGALETTGRYVDIFGAENVYVELQDHGLADQRKTNPWLIDVAKKTGLKTVAAQDLHYVDQSDAKNHSSLLCCQTGSKLSDPDRFQFGSDQYFLHTSEQMRELFSEVPEACDSTLEINERCRIKIDFDTMHLPKFDVPEGYDSPTTFLSKLAFDGLLAKGLTSPEYFERLSYELGVIDMMGVSSYFLIMWDICKFAKRQGIRSGPGRGSACGAILSYCLDITGVDSIKYDLSFERFLNPARVNLPDIDTDWQTDRRDEIINYTIEKYGRDHVAQVITFSEIRARAAVRDATRILGIEPQVGDKISKAMPPLHMGEPTPISGCLEHSERYDFGYKNSEEFRHLYKSDLKSKEIIDVAQGLEGLIRQDGIGAAAVVITPVPLTDLVPIQKKPNSPVVTQWDKKILEELGILKMDFLGLRNLDVLSHAVSMIGDSFDLETIPLDDFETYKLLSSGETTGVFQLSDSGMKSLLKKVQPQRIEDLSAVLALYRPGPMGSNMHNDYADRKNGRQPAVPFHEDATDILADTYQVCVYQEQVSKIAQRFAGYNAVEADSLRKIIGSKNVDKMAEERIVFTAGCIKQGYDEQFSSELFDMIEHFARYSFNKSHALSYSFISYQTAYLKAHYPAEYMAAVCASVSDNIEKSSVYLYEARRMGITVAPPSVIKSRKDFVAVDGDILVGLSSIRNVGAVTDRILEEREVSPFKSFIDFLKRVNPNTRELKSLAQAGALDEFGSRWGIVSVAEELLSQVRKDKKKQVESLFDIDEMIAIEIPTQEYPLIQKMALEKEVVGIYISGHPLDDTTPLKWQVQDLYNVPEDQWVDVLAVVSGVDVKTTRAGAKMAVLQLEDQTGVLEAIIFPKTYEKISAPKLGDVITAGFRIGRDREDQRNFILNRFEVHSQDSKSVEQDTMKFFLPKGFSLHDMYISKLKGILVSHPGKVPVLFWISRTTTMELSESFNVDVSDALLAEVKDLFQSFASR